ncbi:MAG: leucyl aminopeptidase [Candidatus Auribacterota bacterium]|nr:leucyl aminopeptidase [Candidatus Auribacterota bacterium]
MLIKSIHAVSMCYKELAIIPVFENDQKNVDWLEPIDRNLYQSVKKVLDSGDMKGKAGSSLSFYCEEKPFERVLLVGAGKRRDFTCEKLRRLVAGIDSVAQSFNIRAYTIFVQPLLPFPVNNYSAGKATAESISLSRYEFDCFKSKKEKNKKELNVRLFGAPKGAFQNGLHDGAIIAANVNMVRNLINTPSNELTPESIADRSIKLCEGNSRLTCTVMDENAMREHGMNGILSVGKGSANPPRFVIIDYAGENKGKPIVIVGKGVTFDSGGISIKPWNGMEKMKYDMAGAGAVLGIIKIAAELNFPHHIIGLIPTAENMPAATAYKPGDVIAMASGTTVEVISTDAEGRLLLADALHYASDTCKPQALIDLATLTGACMVALGNKAMAIMGNNKGLIRRFIQNDEGSGERVWELPLWEDYDELIKSETADIKNVGGPGAGTIIGGIFLKKFVGKNIPWVHLDIASTAWMDNNEKGYFSKGATGAGVRIICEVLRNWDK